MKAGSGLFRWFPLDRIGDLERLIGREIRSTRRARRRDAIAVALGLHGLRVGETQVARVIHFFAAARSLEVPTFKRGKPRRIDLHASLVTAIDRELRTRGVQSPWLLASNRGGQADHKRPQLLALELFAELLGPDHGLTFHSLRHTFAMRLYAETRDLFLVQRMLGHRSVRSTEVYARSLSEVPETLQVRVSGDSTIYTGEHDATVESGTKLKLYLGGDA